MTAGMFAVKNADAQFCVQQGPCGWQDWNCSCSGDYGGGREGGTTFCVKCVNGKIDRIAVAAHPYTEATGAGFACGFGSPPIPPGSPGPPPDPVTHLNDPTGGTVTVWFPHIF